MWINDIQKKDFVKLISENSKPAFYDGNIWANKGKKHLDKKNYQLQKICLGIILKI